MNRIISIQLYVVLWAVIALLTSSAAWGQTPVTLVEQKPEAETFQNVDSAKTNQTSAETHDASDDEDISNENLHQILINQGIPLTPGNLDLVGSSNYTLGPTDVIEISVMRHPEVSGQFGINNEGNIQYDFVGDVAIAGKTKKEVAKIITDKLSQYIISPEVTVKIVGYNSKVVYVIGEVGRPGKIYMQGDTITVREALVQAGLPLLSAKTAKSKLITPAASAAPETKNVNVQKLLYEGDLRENLVMKPGDTLYVPPTLMAKALRAIQPVAQPIGEAAGTGRTVMTPFP